jgi:hypothetical protein
MKLNINQFDGGGEGDYLPANPAPAAAAPAAPVRDESDDRMARAAASRAREVSASSGYTNPNPGYTNTTTAEGIAAASAAPSPLAMTSGMSAGPKPKKEKTIDKSAWDRGVKVSQKMVDYVKSEGRGNMGSVPQGKVKNGAPGYNGSTFDKNAPVGAEYKEAVKRIYPNGAPAAKAPAKAPAKSPTFNESSPNAKAFPKVAAPKSSKADIRKAENAEIKQANKQGSTSEQIAATITNSLKAYPSLVGLSGTTPKNYQIEGTQTKTQKAQAAAKAERAKAVAKNKNK